VNSRASNPGVPAVDADTAPGLPVVGDGAEFQAAVDRLRTREKAHTREGDAIAAARRRLPMVEVDADLELIGPRGAVTLLDAFEGRRQLIAYYFMWYAGQPAPGQCQSCTCCTTQVGGAFLPSLSRHHVRGVMPGAVRREPPLPRLHGLDDAAVLGAGLRRGASGRPRNRDDVSSAISGTATASSRPTGRTCAVSRPWTTTTH